MNTIEALKQRLQLRVKMLIDSWASGDLEDQEFVYELQKDMTELIRKFREAVKL